MTVLKRNIYKTAASAVCLALCLVLPLLTGQIQQFGNMLCPMHIPVLLCGFICGWQFGFVVGFSAPLLRSLLFSMPVFFPNALAMAFELAAYGLFSGLFYKLFSGKRFYVWVNLLLSMLIGRLVWAAVMYFLFRLGYADFSADIFLTAAFINAVPGILLQLVLVPPIVIAVNKLNVFH